MSTTHRKAYLMSLHGYNIVPVVSLVIQITIFLFLSLTLKSQFLGLGKDTLLASNIIHQRPTRQEWRNVCCF